jgi:hypothetical protein
MILQDPSTLDLDMRGMWKAVREEVGEIVWLASVVGGLSIAGVGLAVALAAV